MNDPDKVTGMVLYPYCSNATFLSIIEHKSVWVSEFTPSNDPLEGRWVREPLAEVCAAKGLDRSHKERLLAQFDSNDTFYRCRRPLHVRGRRSQ